MDISTFEMDNKSVISAINNRIKTLVNTDETIAAKYQKIIRDIFSFISIFNYEFECNYFILEDNVDITKLLKLFGFTVDDRESDWFDRLLNIITLYSDLFPDKILCFYNIKSWLSCDEIKEFYNHITSQKIRVLLIESIKCDSKPEKEHKIVIDEDFDEYLLNSI